MINLGTKTCLSKIVSALRIKLMITVESKMEKKILRIQIAQ